jgi:hypothetical protein
MHPEARVAREQNAQSSAVDSGSAATSGLARERPVKDRYDLVERSDRVGVHRAPERPGSGWFRALIVLLVTAILATLGIVFLVIGPGNVQLPGVIDDSLAGPAAVEVVGEVNPETTIAILNGTPAEGLETAVEQAIRESAWGTIVFAGTAEDRAVGITAVFYVDPKDEALAKGLGENLGGASYYQQPDYATYGTQLIVLLGQDYRGPGAMDMPAAAPGDPAEEQPAE